MVEGGGENIYRQSRNVDSRTHLQRQLGGTHPAPWCKKRGKRKFVCSTTAVMTVSPRHGPPWPCDVGPPASPTYSPFSALARALTTLAHTIRVQLATNPQRSHLFPPRPLQSARPQTRSVKTSAPRGTPTSTSPHSALCLLLDAVESATGSTAQEHQPQTPSA